MKIILNIIILIYMFSVVLTLTCIYNFRYNIKKDFKRKYDKNTYLFIKYTLLNISLYTIFTHIITSIIPFFNLFYSYSILCSYNECIKILFEYAKVTANLFTKTQDIIEKYSIANNVSYKKSIKHFSKEFKKLKKYIN